MLRNSDELLLQELDEALNDQSEETTTLAQRLTTLQVCASPACAASLLCLA